MVLIVILLTLRHLSFMLLRASVEFAEGRGVRLSQAIVNVRGVLIQRLFPFPFCFLHRRDELVAVEIVVAGEVGLEIGAGGRQIAYLRFQIAF